MNDMPTSSDDKRQDPALQTDPAGSAESGRPISSTSSSSTSTSTTMSDRGLVPPSSHSTVYVVMAVVAALLLAHWWVSSRELSGLREEVAQRLRAGETASTEARVQLQSMQDAVRELQSKLNVVESRQSETQSQQLALEQLYHDLARTRDDWTLAEIELVLSTASQQLQIAGNVQGAIIALQNADARLARSDTPQFVRVRRAIANDLERLKGLPTVDLTGIALRLDSAINQVDSMPLLSDEKPAVPVTQPKQSRRPASAAADDTESDWLSRAQHAWTSWANEMWTELKQVIRVRNVETPEALLLSPTQALYARENLKLRLLNARTALMARNETAFRSDLVAAQDAISRYFDPRARQTQTVQALLRQVQGSQLVIELPTLAESLNAVRHHKP